MPQAEAFSRALAAARKAVELDDRSVGAHTSLAFASFWGAWDTVAAEHAFAITSHFSHRRELELVSMVSLRQDQKGQKA